MEEWLDVDGMRISCLTAGKSGQSLVLLHGGGVDNAILSWEPCLQQLAEEYRVFAPDLPGYGRSSKPNITYSIDYYVEFLHSLSIMTLCFRLPDTLVGTFRTKNSSSDANVYERVNSRVVSYLRNVVKQLIDIADTFFVTFENSVISGS